MLQINEMPKFFYIARNAAGEKITGAEEAGFQDEVVNRLQARNLVVVNVIPEPVKSGPKPKAGPKKKRFKHYRITDSDLVLFCRQLATLLGAGISILKSLDIISRQIASRKFYNVIRELNKGMEGGLSFHESMAKHPRVFSDLWVSLVESGEASGNLGLVLERLASFLERNAAFKQKIISSLMYPAILMFAGIGALLFLTIKIIPTFAELFKGFNVTLPLLTRLLIAVSFIIRKFAIIIAGIIIAVYFTFRKYIQTREGRRTYEKIKFKLPLFSEFFRALMAERFSSSMSTLIESGVPLLYSLEITERSVNSVIVGEVIRHIKEDVREGRPLSQTLEKSEFFEPMVVQMVAVGEEIGELPQMFKRINTFYQEYMAEFLTRFTSMFEPLMLIFMGGIIGIMVLGMFLPIFQLAQVGGGG